jgi:hypothetical protein
MMVVLKKRMKIFLDVQTLHVGNHVHTLGLHCVTHESSIIRIHKNKIPLFVKSEMRYICGLQPFSCRHNFLINDQTT